MYSNNCVVLFVTIVQLKENCPIFLHISVDMHDPFFMISQPFDV